MKRHGDSDFMIIVSKSEEGKLQSKEMPTISHAASFTRKKRLSSDLNTIPEGNRIVADGIGAFLDKNLYREDLLRKRALTQRKLSLITK